MKNKTKSNSGPGGEAPVKTKMSKTKLYILVLLVGIGMITWSLMSKQNADNDLAGMKNEDEIVEENQAEMTAGATDENKNASNSLDGVLQNSDDSKLGNYKIVSGNSDVYIRTSRDFSKLVGLQVLVLIDGTLEKFELVDIQPAVQKDGFLISQ
jgi:hypothetical protein